VQSRAITFGYEVRRADTDERLATGSTRLIATDDRGTTRTMPADLIERFREVQHATAP
jgi:acyl-CoA thioesterase FadM